MTGESDALPPPEFPLTEESLTAMLARRAQAGEGKSFLELCERVMPALCGWARLRVQQPLRSRVDPEDIVQETWLRALLTFHQYDASRGSFRGWIFGIAKHVLLQALETARGSGTPASGSTENLRAIRSVADTATSLTRRASASDAVRLFLERALSLGEDDQMLTILCGLEGLTSAEAAKRLGIGEDAAKKRWQRLRNEFAAQGLSRVLLE
jgi:RNA polymerase sigma factor (sigma-70 family)